MAKICEILKTEYANEYDFNIVKKYSEPKIYDANSDLSKRWYVYYSFRNPETGKLTRQTPIYAEVNRFSKLSDRKQAIKNIRDAVSTILRNGFNPYVNSKFDSIDINYTIKDAFDYALINKKSVLSENSYSDFEIPIILQT